MNHYVRDFQGDEYQLLQDSQDIDGVMEHISINQYNCGFLIVKTGEGEYQEIYSSEGFMPFLDTVLEKIL